MLKGLNSWVGEFFSNGHSLEYIYNMSYWDFIELQVNVSESRKIATEETYGHRVAKPLTPSQKEAIEKRKIQRAKEGIKVSKK